MTSVQVRLLVAFAISAAVAIGAYTPAFDSYLVTDDFQWIEGGMTASPMRILSVSDRVHFYRPAIETYFGLMYAAFGCSARALHVASVVFHVVNIGLVMVLARRLVDRVWFAALAGLVFAAQPAPAEAVLWSSAVTTLLCATFGLSMLIVDAKRSRTAFGSTAVVALFAAALACHESAVMLLPAAWLLRYGLGERRPLRGWAREYLACLALLAAYVALTVWINTRNYVVTEGHYTIGTHIARNLVDYLIALYSGRRRGADYLFAVVVWAALVWKGSPRLRAWSVWLIVALLPVLPFAWGTASRYLYIPTIAFSLLVAHGIVWAYDALAARHRTLAVALAMALTLFVVGRSAGFTRKGAEAFRNTAAPYARVAETMRRELSGEVVRIDRATVAWIPPLYVTPLARTAVCDPGVKTNLR
jgi:hypothetical protein